MHVHNPDAKIGAGGGEGASRTGKGRVEGGLGPVTAIFGSEPVYCWRAVIGCPCAIAPVNGTQMLPGLVEVAVPTAWVLEILRHLLPENQN
jgi:hypothetical protein